MLRSQVNQMESTRALLASKRSSLCKSSSPFPSTTPAPSRAVLKKHQGRGRVLRVRAVALEPVKTVEPQPRTTPVTLKTVVTVKDPSWFLSIPSNPSDAFGDTIVLEVVSATSGEIIRETAHKEREWYEINQARYVCNFTLPVNFGELGAVKVQNEHTKEMLFDKMVLTGARTGPTTITCDSWVASKNDNPDMRIFFTNKSYLPSKTPSGLTTLRANELENLRGNGEGERQYFDRIYDYDLYNDLADPDKDPALARPVLGGSEYPYPRRCRTGRGPSETDPLTEKQRNPEDSFNYVPRDEQFALQKTGAFFLTYFLQTLRSILSEKEIHGGPDDGFPHFTSIDSLYNDGLPIPDWIKPYLSKLGLDESLSHLVYKAGKFFLRFPPPDMWKRDRFSWLRDDEFSRQTLAGLNPFSLELVKEWPIKSELDPTIYGPPESLITKEIVEREIQGIMTLEEAVDQKKLFVVDYHDLLLPYVQKVRDLEDTTLYGSRTLFFLRDDGTLKPIAIELVRPPTAKEGAWGEVFTPSPDATSDWLWKFAKAQVAAHDSAYHQLVIHWLRTHCCMEPYIIAANRQLSAMHPIYRLLKPHFRYTMDINAMARKLLISADGVVESTFSPGKYSMEMSAVAYDKLWRFDTEALPADLIRRGMAVEDPTAEHGLKLTIEDYPFANDALMLWDGIKSWVTDYVNHYYPDSMTIATDTELQAWWTEVRTKGHADKKGEPWWPILNTPDSLIQTLSTIIWTASGHHAAVNFGQYGFAGYFPSRPTIARTNMPNEDNTDIIINPEEKFLECLPTQLQATKVMTVLYTLSSHSGDEEYIGQQAEPSWSENPDIMEAFERFQGKMKIMEATITERNTDESLKNRIGSGVVPYDLIKPFSGPGVTGKGVPNSISI